MSEQWQDLPELFHRASELAPDERSAFLDEVCDGKPELRQRLEALLGATKQGFEESDLGGRASSALLGSISNEGVPDSVGQYRLLEPVGSGGMGTVYRAEQEHPKRIVAVKVMSSPFSTESARQRFAYESEVLGRLHHAGIAAIHEAGTFETSIGEQPFFVMEYVEGVDLLRYLEENSLSVRQRVVLAIQICDAVHHAHQNGVVHRDLKPANILIDEHGRPKVLDFGIARVVDRTGATSDHRTVTGQIVGTIGYMSPEQAAGSREVDARSDVYSLGVILYQLICGRLPHPTENLSVPEVLQSIVEKDPPSLGTVTSEARGDLEIVVGKALDREADRRYPSASEFAADLRRYLDDEPITARPPSAVYQVKKFAKRNRQLVAGVSVGVLLLVGGLVLAVAGYVEADDARETAVDRATEADRVIALFSHVFATVSERGREARVIDALDATRLKLDTSTSESPAILGRMKQVLATGYAYLGEPTLAESLLDEAVEAFPEAVNPEKYWGMQADRALFIGRAGREEEALNLLDQVLERYRDWYGVHSERTLQAELRYAEFVGESGRYELEERKLRSILDRALRSLGPDHEVVESTHHQLAGVLTRLNRNAEAIELLEEVIEARRVRSSDSALDTLGSTQLLGAAYFRAGEYPKSLEVLTEAWEIQKQFYGHDHPSALNLGASVGTVLSDMGRLDEAEAITREVLEATERKLGPVHPATQTSRGNLAQLYWRRQEYQKAADMYAKSIEVYKVQYGENHDSTLQAELNLAENLRSLGLHDEAEERMLSVLERCRQSQGETAHLTLAVSHNLAGLYRATGRLAQAEELYRRVIAAPRFQLTPKAEHFLATILSQTGRKEEAVELMTSVLEWVLPRLGEQHRNTVAARWELYNFLYDLGRYEEAIEHVATLYRVYSERMGESHPRALPYLESRTRLELKTGKIEVAESSALQLVALWDEAIARAGDEATAELLLFRLFGKALLADVRRDQGRFDEAIDMHRAGVGEATDLQVPPIEVAVLRHGLAKTLIDAGKAAVESGESPDEHFESAEEILLSLQSDMSHPESQYLVERGQTFLHDLYTAWGKPERAAEYAEGQD